MAFVGAAAAWGKRCRGRMEAVAGSALFQREKNVARRPGWPGVGFAVGVAKTGKLELFLQPVASMEGVCWTLWTCRVGVRAVGNCEPGRISIGLHVDLAGGSAPNSSWVVSSICLALGQKSTTTFGGF